MKNITLSADEALIEAARARARQEHTTLNEQFRRWLEQYSRQPERAHQYDRVVSELSGKLQVGSPLTREQMNER
ncbi:MAG: hypothetical protein WA888_06350 [Burkholderiaceae bacterium]